MVILQRQPAASISPTSRLDSASDAAALRSSARQSGVGFACAESIEVHVQAPKQHKLACDKAVCVFVKLNLLTLLSFLPHLQQRRDDLPHLLRSPHPDTKHLRPRRTLDSASLCNLHSVGPLLLGLKQGLGACGLAFPRAFCGVDQVVREKFCVFLRTPPTSSAMCRAVKNVPAGEAAQEQLLVLEPVTLFVINAGLESAA